MHFNLTGLCPVRRKAAFFSKHSTLVFLMRAGFVYVVIGIVTISMLFANVGNSQTLEEIRVTVELNNESLPQLFEKIQAQTNLVFGYRLQETDKVAPLTFGTQTLTVKALLDQAFMGTLLKYKQVNNSVIVFEDEPTTVSPLSTSSEPVTGKVTDKAGNPIPGVSVLILGTTIGTQTDAEGKYSINVPPRVAEDGGDYTLVFTFIGYKKVAEPLNGRILVNITMEEETNTLQEVVISGGVYETTDKLKTGSIVKVTAKDIENQPVTSPLMALQGRVAGLDITSQSGTPGAAPRIRIRGTNSLRTSSDKSLRTGGGSLTNRPPLTSEADDGNYPLYVIDDVPFSSIGVTSWSGDTFDPISTIGPDNIESITILKDGDATAIYGSLGANGVILITTKRAKESEGKTNFNFNTYQGFGVISKKVELLNTRQFVAMRKEALAFNGTDTYNAWDYDVTQWDNTRYTDWQEVLLGGTAKIMDFDAAISSGNKNTSFRLGGNYHRETLVTPGDFGYHRASGSLSVSHSSNDQKFKLSVTTNFGIDGSEMYSSGADNLVQLARTLPPNAPRLYDENGGLNWEILDVNTNPNGGEVLYPTFKNPIGNLLATFSARKQTLIANGNLGYEVLPGFLVSANLGLSDLSSNQSSKTPSDSHPPISLGGVADFFRGATFRKEKVFTWNIDPQISYRRQLGKHKLEIVAGATWRQTTSSLDNALGTGYSSNSLLGSISGAASVDYISRFSDFKYMSVYSRAGYNFKNTYLINLTGRRDGSSRFGPNNRFGNFWSIGSAWIFSEEKFIKTSLPFLSFGKIRASYGIAGSDGGGDYRYYDLYALQGSNYQGIPGFIPNALYNPDFAWGQTRKLDFAFESGFFKNRITTEINWYRSWSSNQLVDYTLPATTGFPSVLQNFEAIVQNTGWEIVLRADVISKDDFTWNAAINLTIPDNKLLKFPGLADSPYATYYKIGEPLSVQWVYVFKGVNPQTGLNEVVDLNNDGLINTLDRKLQTSFDKAYYGGLNNTVQYKRFELNFLLYFAFQDKPFLYTEAAGKIAVNQPATVLDRWQRPGDISTLQRFESQNLQSSSYAAFSNFNSTDASYIRLTTASLAYRFPVNLIERVKLQQAKIFLRGQNLFTLTRYKGPDPQTGIAYTLPPLRMLTVGVQLQF